MPAKQVKRRTKNFWGPCYLYAPCQLLRFGGWLPWWGSGPSTLLCQSPRCLLFFWLCCGPGFDCFFCTGFPFGDFLACSFGPSSFGPCKVSFYFPFFSFFDMRLVFKMPSPLSQSLSLSLFLSLSGFSLFSSFSRAGELHTTGWFAIPLCSFVPATLFHFNPYVVNRIFTKANHPIVLWCFCRVLFLLGFTLLSFLCFALLRSSGAQRATIIFLCE